MEKTEMVFNLFYYSNLDLITAVGGVMHELNGTDEEKINFLKTNADKDFKSAQKFDLPNNFQIKIHGVIRKGIDHISYRNLCNDGHNHLIFDLVFRFYNASPNSLVVITPVKNGEIFFEGNEDIKAPLSESPKYVHVDKQKEWYVDYIDGQGFHFDKLINDDFIEAVRILFNAKHYVSAMKLLMICIDTVAYLEFGDYAKNFHNWLNTYVELASINITNDELWEFRNSILHMTNLDSRKVQAGKVNRLQFYVAHSNAKYPKITDEGKTFEFRDLLEKVGYGINKWALSYNHEAEKFETLLNRYDRIISDKRMTSIYMEEYFNR